MTSTYPKLPRKLKSAESTWVCPASWIPKATKSTEPAAPIPGLHGQSRALDAIRMALAVDAPGYNVFVCGLGGIGQAEVVAKLIEHMALKCDLPKDHVYVHNFADPFRPTHLALAAGKGTLMRQGMEGWVHVLAREIPKFLSSDEHQARRNEMSKRYEKRESQLFQRLGRRAKSKGLALVQVETESGTRNDIYFLIGGKVFAPDDALQLPPEARPKAEELQELMTLRETFLTELSQAHRKARQLGLRLIREVGSIDEEVIQEVVEDVTLALAEELDADIELASWLGDCAQFALQSPQLFLRQHIQQETGEVMGEELEDAVGLECFQVNVVRQAKEGCPIVFEQHPNYANLFGAVERRIAAGGLGRIHMAVRPGSILQADGGYLVLNARDIFQEAEVWRALKRTMQTGQLEIHALETMSPLGSTGIRPEALRPDLKLILVGSGNMWDFLHDDDYEFRHIFKVKAEFQNTLELNAKNVGSLVSSLRETAAKEGLPKFTNSGMRAVVELGVRTTGRRNRVSTRLPRIMDFAREAAYLARINGKKSIDRQIVNDARNQYMRQHSADAEWHQRMLEEGIYDISTDGEKVGTVNALTVVQIGPLGFGRPCRVSAMVSAGDESMSNIERDVDLAGSIYNKGMHMVVNFLRWRYGQEKTIPARMSLAFDQSYGPIDGDSASSTEVYAVLSELTGLPIRQDLAVTGAINMKGDVLAIGGINEKVEGFFNLCAARGLTGKQGILLPKANVEDLMLPPEIVAAVRARKFHLYEVEHVDQGIALLTGKSIDAVSKAVRARLELLAGDDESKDDSSDEAAKKSDDKKSAKTES